jgi:hypothetical protein
VHAGFHAEGAADIARQHTDIGRRDLKIAGGNRVAQAEGRLVGGVELDPPVLGDLGPGAARLHRVGGDARDGEVEGGDVGRSGQSGGGAVRVAALPQEPDIVGHTVPDRRSA